MFHFSKDVKKISSLMEDAITLLQNQQSFHSEAAILSRLIYKLGTKFRHDIGFSFLKRTHVAVKKYLNLNILNNLKTFSDVISDATKGYYPTRQMLEFILIRLQTFSKLMDRIEVCAKKSATLYLERIRRGDAWWLSFMPYSVLSRIWYISRHLLKNCCKWYSTLFPFRKNLKAIGLPFVPEEYEFPSDLNQWLCINDEEPEECKESFSDLPMDTSGAESIIEKYDMKKINHSANSIIKDNIIIELKYKNISDDIGEVISRDSFKRKKENDSNDNSLINTDFKNHSKQIQIEMTKNENSINLSPCKNITNVNVNKIKQSHSIHNVRSINSFKQFVDLEEKYRKNNNSKSLTSHLGFVQWHSLKTIINQLVCKISDKNKNKILKRIENAWKTKCTLLQN